MAKVNPLHPGCRQHDGGLSHGRIQLHRTLFTFFLLLLLSEHLAGQPFSFRKVNSGTKSDIRSISQDKSGGLYFLTDKIYTLDKEAWRKVDVPVEEKIYYFNALSANDFWFNVNQVTNTCVLYHYHDGITEIMRPPLANSITSMCFSSENKALFAGYADMAVYDNGSFMTLPPSPARYGIIRIYGESSTDFYILTGKGGLFLYQNGVYKTVLNDKAATDFCFSAMQDGYILAGTELFRVDKAGVKLIHKSVDFQNVNKMCLTKTGKVLMVGDKGLIMSFNDGRVVRHDSHCTENLTDVVATETGEIWACGANGRLLYSGAKQFPGYAEENQGFSPYKLIYYGISTDDEYGVAMADFDGDDLTDIYAVRISEQNRMYVNNLSPSNRLSLVSGFSEEAVKRNATAIMTPQNNLVQNELKLGIGVADIDNDDDQDIYLCYLNSNNRLLINRGNGYFRNVSSQKNRACENLKRSNSATFSDVDNDGDLDLFVTNEEGSNRLFENDGSGHFTDITELSGVASPGGGMCATFADVNSDGFADLCVTFWYPCNKLYFNETKNGRIFFREVTHLTDLSKATPSKSNGVVFADVNNDGFTDLFIANRNNGNKLYLNNGKGMFFDKTRDYFRSEKSMSNGAAFADFDLDGYQDLYVTNVGENVLYKNVDGRYFKDVTSMFGAELSGYCTGCATGDVDNDGDPDLYVANYINGNSNLFLNMTEKRNFVKIKLHGVRSSKDAIGAKVWLYMDSGDKSPEILAGYRELSGGSGYSSVSAKEMIFGVVKGATYHALVKFPSSADTIRIDHLTAGKSLVINELNGFQAFREESGNRIVRFFTDQENQPENAKYLFVFLLLLFYNLKLRKSIRNITIFRMLTSSFIFIVFVFVNQIFLFQWFSISFFIAPVVVVGLLVIDYLVVDRILMRRLAQKEKLELREKLSRDLHDDLASTLGSISIYAETLSEMSGRAQPELSRIPMKIAGLTKSALQAISDIIWMTSPRNDSLQSLVSKTRNYMLEILSDNKIRFRSTVEIPAEPIILVEKLRNDAFLILKEGLHNILRHSGAGSVEFIARLEDNQFTVRLKDDGVGFADSGRAGQSAHGNGLLNMRKRAQESSIGLEISSTPGSGTEIIMKFKI